MSCAKWRPFCPGGDELRMEPHDTSTMVSMMSMIGHGPWIATSPITSNSWPNRLIFGTSLWNNSRVDRALSCHDAHLTAIWWVILSRCCARYQFLKRSPAESFKNFRYTLQFGMYLRVCESIAYDAHKMLIRSDIQRYKYTYSQNYTLFC